MKDKFNYKQIIQDALPGCQIDEVDNFDDISFGYDISPIPGTLIRFEIEQNDHFYLHITMYRILVYDMKVVSAKLFNGTIPYTKDMEPDFYFIRTLLNNYFKIG